MGSLEETEDRYEHHRLEALWVSWGLNKIDQDLLRSLLRSNDYRVRAAAVKVLRFAGHQVEDQADLLMTAGSDQHSRVRMEAAVTALRMAELYRNKPEGKRSIGFGG